MASSTRRARSRSETPKPVVPTRAVRLLDQMNRRWVPHLMYLLAQGEARFTDLAEALPTLSRRLLTERLRELAAEGLIDRLVEAGPPMAVSYRLTSSGVRAWADLGSIVTGSAHPSSPDDSAQAAQADPELRDAPHQLVRARGIAGPGAFDAGPGPRSAMPPEPPEVFVGRAAQIRELEALIESNAVVEVSGPAGIGKTALVAQWARYAHRPLPDCVLYADVSGKAPADILWAFLRDLGQEPRDIPTSLPERAERFGQVAAECGAVVIVDSVTDTMQISPLLAASDDVRTVLVTRWPLPGLSQPHVGRLTVGPLAAGEALSLLRALAGDRVDGQLADAAALAELCCHQPAALYQTAQHLRSDPAVTLSDLIARIITSWTVHAW